MIFLLDATLGMYLISKGLKLVGKLQTSRIVECQNWNLLVFGKCGVSSQVKAWLGQCTLYLIITVCEKMVIIVILLIPGLTKFSKFLLSYIPYPWLKLAIVMLIIPLITNVIFFYCVDMLLIRQRVDGSEKAYFKTVDEESGPRPSDQQVLLSSDPETSESDCDSP
eukprot:gi/632978315/ref/XP_007905840.1/ PREDICTED: transmembrane protein 110-like [Callorhinchus milii]